MTAEKESAADSEKSSFEEFPQGNSARDRSSLETHSGTKRDHNLGNAPLSVEYNPVSAFSQSFLIPPVCENKSGNIDFAKSSLLGSTNVVGPPTEFEKSSLLMENSTSQVNGLGTNSFVSSGSRDCVLNGAEEFSPSLNEKQRSISGFGKSSLLAEANTNKTGFSNSSLLTTTSGETQKAFSQSALLTEGLTNKATTDTQTGSDLDLFGNNSRYESMIHDTHSFDGETRKFYTARLSDGRCIRVARKNRQCAIEGLKEDEGSSRNYYGIPIHKMLAELKHEKEQRADKEQELQKVQFKSANKSSTRLLSERWRPSKWIDLVGPERTHRAMLKWLVAWSPIVFKTQPPGGDNRGLEKVDSLGRPLKKILLIHGPPGIGKTTVAHILAKQAGYDVVEINASDERSGQEVRTKVHNSMNNHRVIGSGKPVCIVADEIEGAAESGFIRVLLNMIESDGKALNERQNNSNNSKKKKKRAKLIQRPIIAICNDLYAPSLRELRNHAEIVNYTNISNHTMVNRLREICAHEDIRLDTSELKEIAETTQGDLRSSLNILQFGITRNPDGSLAKKDLNKSWSVLANRVFKRRTDISKNEDSRNILKEIDGFGEHDKLVNGCFSLYPQMNYHDDMLKKPCALGDWTHFYEQLNNAIYSSQHQVGQYLNQPILAFYSLFNSAENTKNERIRSDYEIYETLRKNASLCREFLSYSDPQLQQIFDKNSAALELAPYSMQIMSPNVDTPSAMKSEGKAKIANTANAMMCLNASFKKDRLEGGTLIYRIDPPIEQLAIFNPEKRQRYTVGKYSTRQVISESIHKERLKHNKAGEKRPSQVSTEPVKKRRTEEKAKKQKRDFFGRIVVESELQQVVGDGDDNGYGNAKRDLAKNDENSHVWIQYVEGFSNAVRKDLTWSEFWS